MNMVSIFILHVLIITFVAQKCTPTAEPCNPTHCEIPNCRCSSTDNPADMDPSETPQFVVFTFDDEVTASKMSTYRELFYNRTNKNGCPISVTFYVCHEHKNTVTDYQLVNELRNNGFEIGLHSITHKPNSTYWVQGTYDELMKEFGGQKTQIEHFANIPANEIKGMRGPFLHMTGNTRHQVVADIEGLEYDITWATIDYIAPGLWPYTLEFKSTQDCVIPPCPTTSIPGSWIFPMISWIDVINEPCLMADSCVSLPDRNDVDEWYKFIMNNFNNQYLGNRAPFGFHAHEVYFHAYPAAKEALVNAKDVIDWIKNPVTLDQYMIQSCKEIIPSTCEGTTCQLRSEHNGLTQNFSSCTSCPEEYPWIDNPLGYRINSND